MSNESVSGYRRIVYSAVDDRTIRRPIKPQATLSTAVDSGKLLPDLRLALNLLELRSLETLPARLLLLELVNRLELCSALAIHSSSRFTRNERRTFLFRLRSFLAAGSSAPSAAAGSTSAVLTGSGAAFACPFPFPFAAPFPFAPARGGFSLRFFFSLSGPGLGLCGAAPGTNLRPPLPGAGLRGLRGVLAPLGGPEPSSRAYADDAVVPRAPGGRYAPCAFAGAGLACARKSVAAWDTAGGWGMACGKPGAESTGVGRHEAW